MNIKSLTSVSVLILSTVMLSAQAADFSYDYIDGSYERYDLDGPDADIFRLSGSYELSSNYNIIAEYATGDIDNPTGGSDLDFDEGVIGLGYHTGISQATDLTVNVKVISRDTDLAGDDTGYGLGVGVRHMLTDRIEVDGNIDFVDVNDNQDTAVKVGARYYFNEAISTGLSYSTSSDDVDIVSAGIRWDF